MIYDFFSKKIYFSFFSAALVEGTIFCMHGGLSPQLMDLSQIRNIPRPIDVPDSGLVCDLLWGDPDEVSIE